jgi:hypothetical protein
MMWPCGPLEEARLAKEGRLSVEARQTLRRWQEPAALDLLKGTPFNCVVVRCATGLPEDREQLRVLAPLIRHARSAGLTVVGLVEGSADKTAALAAAHSAGVAVAAVDDPLAASRGLPLIQWAPTAKAHWEHAADAICIADRLWPRLRSNTPGEEGGADAGPTGTPWVDSNGWFLQLARTLAPAKAVWLAVDPPRKAGRLRPEGYIMSLADCAAYGGRAVLSLDDGFRDELVRRSAAANEAWTKIVAAARFFESHREWGQLLPVAALGIVCGPSWADDFMAGEVLNLLSRRQVCFCLLKEDEFTRERSNNFEAMLWAHEKPPSQALRRLRPEGYIMSLADCAAYGGRAEPLRSPSLSAVPTGEKFFQR